MCSSTRCTFYIFSKTRYSHCSLLHISSTYPLHPYPARYTGFDWIFCSIRYLTKYNLHCRVNTTLFVIFKQINIHRSNTEMCIVVTFTEHGNIKFVILVFHIYTRIKCYMIRICTHLRQTFDSYIVLILMVSFNLKIIGMIST